MTSEDLMFVLIVAIMFSFLAFVIWVKSKE